MFLFYYIIFSRLLNRIWNRSVPSTNSSIRTNFCETFYDIDYFIALGHLRSAAAVCQGMPYFACF